MSVCAAAAVGRNSLFLERLGLGYQIFCAPADAVGSQKSHHCGHAAPDQIRKLHLGSLCVEASLTAAACNMDMAVNESRRHDPSCSVDHLAALIFRKILPDPLDLFTGDEHVLFPKILRCIHLCPFD